MIRGLSLIVTLAADRHLYFIDESFATRSTSVENVVWIGRNILNGSPPDPITSSLECLPEYEVFFTSPILVAHICASLTKTIVHTSPRSR